VRLGPTFGMEYRWEKTRAGILCYTKKKFDVANNAVENSPEPPKGNTSNKDETSTAAAASTSSALDSVRQPIASFEAQQGTVIQCNVFLPPTPEEKACDQGLVDDVFFDDLFCKPDNTNHAKMAAGPLPNPNQDALDQEIFRDESFYEMEKTNHPENYHALIDESLLDEKPNQLSAVALWEAVEGVDAMFSDL